MKGREREADVAALGRPAALLVGPRVSRNLRLSKDLRKDGLEVLSAEWAWEALDIYRFVGARVTVVLVDEQLAGDDPQAVVLALHRLDPGVRTMVVTPRQRTQCAQRRSGLPRCS